MRDSKINLINCIDKIIIVFLLFGVTACDEMFQYSPYDATVSTSDVNSENIQKILARNNSGDTLHIATFADSHNYYEDLRDAVSFINRNSQIDFVIIAGDVTETGLSQQYEWYLNEIRKLEKPFVTVIGNHDFLSNGATVYSKMFGAQNFYFDYNGYRFIGFNDVVWENNNTAPNFDWLSNALQSINSGLRPVIIAHIQPWTDDQLGDKYSQIYQEIAEANNVILSVSGHSHGFQITKKNDITYLISGSVSSRGISIIHLCKGDIRIERVEY